MSTTDSTPAPVRRCGPCHACCELPEIPDLQKPRYVRCQYQTSPTHVLLRELGLESPADVPGCCGVFGESIRPAICSEYKCWWLFGSHPDLLHDEDRPDKCGLMLEIGKPNQLTALIRMPIVTAHELWEGAHLEAPG